MVKNKGQNMTTEKLEEAIFLQRLATDLATDKLVQKEDKRLFEQSGKSLAIWFVIIILY